MSKEKMEALTIKLLWPKEIDDFYEILKGFTLHAQNISDMTQGVDRTVDPRYKDAWLMADEIMRYIEEKNDYKEIDRPTFPREK